MSYHVHYDGKITVPHDREKAAVTALAAAVEDLDPTWSLHAALCFVFRDAADPIDDTDGGYEMSGSHKWHQYHDDALDALAEFGWGYLEVEGEDRERWKIVLTGGTVHHLEGVLTYEGEEDVTHDIDPYSKAA